MESIKIEAFFEADGTIESIVVSCKPTLEKREQAWPFSEEQWQEIINRMIEFKDNLDKPNHQVRFLNNGYNTLI